MFLSDGHMRYHTTVREPDILRCLIAPGYVTFYQINIFFCKYIIFSIITKCLCNWMKCLHSSDLARGP